MDKARENDEGMQAMEARADQRIAWALAHPGTSEWLKQSLRAALVCDPVALLNDLGMLNQLLEPRAKNQIRKDMFRILKQ